MGMTCRPGAYGRCTVAVGQVVARTPNEGGVLRGKRFKFMALDCVVAADHSFRNLRAVTMCGFSARFLCPACAGRCKTQSRVQAETDGYRQDKPLWFPIQKQR